MITNKSVYSALAAVLMGGAWANAQQPVISIVNDRNGAAIEGLSDNGAWAVGHGKSVIDEGAYSFPKLYNVKSKETKSLYKNGEENRVGQMMANDVTDDGSIVVGQYNGKPAIWYAGTEEWKTLPVKARGFTYGQASSITPDGKYAIGTASNPNWNETIVVWDLTGDEPVDITPANLPKPITMSGMPQQYEQLRAVAISPDGSKFIGLVGFSYMGEQWTFVYDMATNTWDAIGFEVTENGNGYKFNPTGSGYFFTEGGQFRPGTNEIAGSAWLDSDVEGIYIYDMDTKKITIVDGSASKLFGGVDRYGLIYASNPAGQPYRNWEVKAGNYWYDFKVIARQLWGMDWQNDVLQDEYGLSGTFRTLSDDGLVLVANEYTNTPYDSYVIELDKPLSELCQQVNILDNYVVSPVNNSAFAMLREVKVMFDRNIEVLDGKMNAVTCSGAGNNYNSTSVSVDPGDSRVLNIIFRNRRLEVGETYTLTIPEGVVCVAGDAEKLNPEINVNYKGRPQAPVSPLNISPADGIKLEKINASTNPLVITFDADLAAVDAADAGHMYLYLLNDEGGKDMISQLNGSIEGNALAVFPIMEQRLAIGSNYEVVIEKNVVADISGADPNEEIVLHYDGAYIPDESDPRKPFFDDFNSGLDTTKWMLYDGDQLEPAQAAKDIDFTKGVPWWFGRDTNASTDMYAMSHSMYDPVGQSDDWMVSRQIYIADETCVLSFKSQSYRKNVEDRLKVYIYESDDVYTALTPSIVDRIRYADGALVYDEVQSPGENEETTVGEWKENVIPLDKYAGKYIYIAFVNDNRNKSAVFVDDVMVSRDVKYILANLSDQTVVRADEMMVKGLLTIESLTDTYKGYELTLVDAEGNVVSTLVDADKELAQGEQFTFTFPDPLKLTVGKVVNYGINLKLGDEISEKLTYSVKDLAVETTKRVVIEEFTGQGCPNCPLGHAALDIIEKDFGDKVIPLSIHTYTGDSFATPQAAALTEFLGLTAAPTGRVNRGPVSSPLFIDNGGKYYYKDNGLWYDYVVAELSEYADADIAIPYAAYDGDKFTVNVEMTYALDMDNRNVNVFAVIAEDGLQGNQDNNRSTVEDPVLGDWGMGGIYGQTSVPYIYHDVVRSYFGTTCNGTGGFIPAEVVGGQPYTAEIEIPKNRRILDPLNTSVTVMMIDASTGLVVNANRARVSNANSVEGIETDGSFSARVENGNVVVNAASLTLVDVYAVDGTRLASQAGEGEFSVDVNGYNGVALVTLRNDNVSKTVKVFVK